MIKRDVNLESMSDEAFSELIEQLGAKVNDKLKAAKEDVDLLLSRFGLEAELCVNIVKINNTEE